MKISRLFGCLLISSLLLNVNGATQSWRSWECGSNVVFESLSWMITAFSDRSSINKCCRTHDSHYDAVRKNSYPYTNAEADWIFEKCLERTCTSFQDRYIVKPIFTFAVTVNSWLKKIFGFSF